jgi:Protein of unknown function (DUF3987)
MTHPLLDKWQQTLASAPPEARPQVFRDAAHDIGGHVGNGITKPDALDGLVTMASVYDSFGLDGAEIERIIGEEFASESGDSEADREAAAEMVRRWEEADRERGQGKGNGADAASAALFDPWERYIVPDFPLHVLPPSVRDYVPAQAAVIGCDPAALAMAVLTAFSGALDHRFAVKMMKNGNWWEHPRLWTLLVGDPSRKKTPIINDVMRPLERHQNDLRRDYEARLRDYEAAKKDKDKDSEKPDPPVRFVVWDTTTEKLGEILSRSEHGLLGQARRILGLDRRHGKIQ